MQAPTLVIMRTKDPDFPDPATQKWHFVVDNLNIHQTRETSQPTCTRSVRPLTQYAEYCMMGWRGGRLPSTL